MAPTTVRDLTPAPYNPRRITDEKLAALGRSMARFGDLSGIVYNRRTGRVVSGHQRLKHLPPDAAVTITERLHRPNEQGTVALGYIDWQGERWTYREVDWSEEDEKAANIAANKHGGELDMPKLADLLAELHGAGYDIELTGFDEQELADLLKWEPEGGDDDLADPDEDEPAVSRVGDRWRLGRHLLIVGDSASPPPEADGAHLVVFDPPFDADYFAWTLPPAPVVAVWGRGKRRIEWEAATLIPAGYEMHELVITGGVRGQAIPSMPCCVHDVIHVWRKRWWHDHPGATPLDNALVRRIDWPRTEDDRPYSHKPNTGGVLTGLMSWGKPVSSMEVLLVYGPNGSLVYDPCAGSGSSLIACERHGRRWVGVELQPRWADLIVRRWEKETGKQATFEGSAATFEEVAAERLGASG